jgi:hypothetical protein
MRKPPSDDDKIVKLKAHVDAAETMRQIMDHPAYAGFFNAYEQALADKMLTAPVLDDDARRSAAIELQILKKFRRHLADVAQRGERAKNKLEELEKKTNAG